MLQRDPASTNEQIKKAFACDEASVQTLGLRRRGCPGDLASDGSDAAVAEQCGGVGAAAG